MSLLVLRASAQPGWRDLSQHFSFTVLDGRGQAIHFGSDRRYSISVNGHAYSGRSIPHDSLLRTPYMSSKFTDQIRINDFSLSLPLNEKNHLPISIARGKDTMHLWPSSNITVRFAPGYFYFTQWAGNLLEDEGIRASGNLHIVNQDQRVFSVPGDLFVDALAARRWEPQEKLEAIVNRQVAAYIHLSRTEQPVQFQPSLYPFDKKRWEGPIYPTKDSNVFAGIFYATYDHDNSSWSVGTLGRFNRRKNRVDLWMPRPNPRKYIAWRLFRNPFTGQFYASGAVRDSAGPDDRETYFEQFPYTMGIYRSDADAQHWTWMSQLQGLTGKELYEHIDFPDAQHVLTFFRRYPIGEQALYRTQGVFYLLRNDVIVDSFITPAKISFDDNYNGYDFHSQANDSLRLGHWGVTGNAQDNTVTQVLLQRKEGGWKFVTEKETEREYWARIRRPLAPAPRKPSWFRQFRIDSTILTTASGSLQLREEPLKVLERGGFICLFYADALLFSRDGGHNWFYCPGFFDQHSEFELLDGDSSGRVWFWDMSSMLRITLQL